MDSINSVLSRELVKIKTGAPKFKNSRQDLLGTYIIFKVLIYTLKKNERSDLKVSGF